MALLSEAAAKLHRNLSLENLTYEYGICKWGCGYKNLNKNQVVEDGHVIAVQHPLKGIKT